MQVARRASRARAQSTSLKSVASLQTAHQPSPFLIFSAPDADRSPRKSVSRPVHAVKNRRLGPNPSSDVSLFNFFCACCRSLGAQVGLPPSPLPSTAHPPSVPYGPPLPF